MKVKDFMTRDLTAVSEETTLKDTAKILAQHRVSGVPVVDKKQIVVGFISEKDLIRSAFPHWFISEIDSIFFYSFAKLVRQLSQVGERKVKDFMTHHAICVDEDAPVAKVAELMVKKKVKLLPVVREGKLVGIVSRADLVRALMEEPATP